jgi:hypothetical protein
MKGFYYALVGVYNDLSYLARLGRYHAWCVVMAVAWRVDLWFVRLHTHALKRATRLDRGK